LGERRPEARRHLAGGKVIESRGFSCHIFFFLRDGLAVGGYQREL